MSSSQSAQPVSDRASKSVRKVPSGAFRSPPDHRDWEYEALVYGSEWAVLPAEFDLRHLASPVRDQGDRGTCAAIVGATICEMQMKRGSGGENKQTMSPEFIYFHRENKPAHGMYGKNLFRIMHKIGVPAEHLCEYVSDDDREPDEPSRKAYADAAKHRIHGYARVRSIHGVKMALYSLGPVYMALPLYSTRPHFWRPLSEDDIQNGGHSVTIVGYNTEGFIVRNSWGDKWNGDGHIIFPYCDWSSQWECWVSTGVTNERRWNLFSRRNTRCSLI